MDYFSSIISHTRKLLHYGVFSHMTDGEISILHYRILNGNNNESSSKSLLRLWRMGNFNSDFSRLVLLQETNYLLQKFGEQMIEEDFLEIIDVE